MTADAPTALGPVGQVSRSVSDIGRAVSWYRETLGLRHLFTFGTLAFFDLGGFRLFLSEAKGTPERESTLYFRVTDIRRTHAELAARGVDFIDTPHRIHRHPDGLEEWMCFFRDPDGRPLALMGEERP